MPSGELMSNHVRHYQPAAPSPLACAHACCLSQTRGADLWTAQKSAASEADGVAVPPAYPDATMKIVFMPASDELESTLTGMQEAADLAIEGSCPEADMGAVLTVASPSSCYTLHFDDDIWQTIWKIGCAESTRGSQ